MLRREITRYTAIYPDLYLSIRENQNEAISHNFGISENYLGRYFKKHTNETMQQYILNYKLKLVENRLLHSEMRISEIVAELGFTDESHLNKLFKKYRGCSPTNFRKNNAV